MPIAVLVNPLSGKGKAVDTGTWITKQLTLRKVSHQLFSTSWPGSLADFSEIWIVGGDGTFNYFINHYENNTLPLALFKGGTGNDFAWKLYGNISLEQQLENALRLSPRPVDAGRCNGRLYVNSTGIGFDGEVLRCIGTIRWLGGHIGYLWIVIRKIFSFKEFDFSITMGEKFFNEKFLLVIVNNSSRTGGGFLITPRASLTDGKLDIVLCKPLSLFKRLRYLPVIEKGKHLSLPFIFYTQEHSVHIESTKELYAQLDGELISSKIFDFEILPGRLLIRY